MIEDASRDDALRDLRAYKRARARLHPAVVAADAARVPQTVIAAESGLSRDGVRKIITRAATTTTTTSPTRRPGAS